LGLSDIGNILVTSLDFCHILRVDAIGLRLLLFLGLCYGVCADAVRGSLGGSLCFRHCLGTRTVDDKLNVLLVVFICCGRKVKWWYGEDEEVEKDFLRDIA